MLIESHSEIFTPLINMTFELLIGKFTDSKVMIRNKATDIMISLINLIGLVSGFEKLTANLSNKNFRVREQVLLTVIKLFDLYNEDIMFMPNLISKIAALLNDSQNTVRQIAINLFAKLYSILGDSIFDELEAEGIKPNQVALIQAAIDNGPVETVAMDDLENQLDINIIETSSVADTVKSNSPHVNKSSKSQKVEQIADNREKSSKISGSSRAASVGRQRTASSNSTTTTNPTNNSNKTNGALSKCEQDSGTCASWSSSSFMNLLGEGNEVNPISVYSEKELMKVMGDIIHGLRDVDDWQTRMKALGLLQGLALGDGIEFDTFVTHLKGCHELILNQISDLRSIVMKEACRTVGFLATRLGCNFAVMAELLLPVLMKQVVVKIQVMSSAADRCIRIIIKSAVQGFPRLLSQFLENCSSKTPTLRKSSYEYLCLAVALWKIEVLEKSLGSIKFSLKSGMNDADLNTRKAARQLFWVSRSRVQWKATMDAFLLELEPSTQKHALAEFQNSSTEFLELIEMIGKPCAVENESEINRVQSNYLNDESNGNGSSKARQAAPRPSFGSVRQSQKISKQELDISEKNDVDSSKGSNVVAAVINNLSEVPKPPRRLSIAPSRMITPSMNDFQNQRADTDLAPPIGVLATIGLGIASNVESQMIIEEKETVDDKVSSFTVTKTLIDGPKRIIEGPKRVMKSKVEDQKNQELRFAAALHPPPLPAEILSNNAPAANFTNTSRQKKTDDDNYSVEILRNMTEDSNWESRLKGFEIISKQIKKLISLEDKSNALVIETYVDMAVSHIGDQHQKVAIESLQVINKCIESFHSQCIPKLGSILTSLFHRLADRRMPVRDQANTLLNNARVTFDPVSIISALSPKIVEIPDRMKTAVIQFLVIIAPHCSPYFNSPQNAWAFLGRMANVLGCGSTPPSTTLTVAGKRLLELVYNTSPNTILSQLAVLPLQQQTTLKKMLSSISDIDMLVANAGKMDRMKGHINHENLITKSKTVVEENRVTKKIETGNTIERLPTPPTKTLMTAPPRDMVWLLDSLRPNAQFLNKKEAISEIKTLISTGSEEFWRNSCAPLVSVILENFNPILLDNEVDESCSHPNTPSLKFTTALTGFTPETNEVSHTACSKADLLSQISPQSPIINLNAPENPKNQYYEVIHLLCKVLLILVRTRGKHIKVFMELITTRLCQVVEYAPSAIILHCEQILADLGGLDPLRFLHLLIPYSNAIEPKGRSPQVRLLALHAMTSVIHNLASPQLLENINNIMNAALPSLSSSLVDLRKAAIFLLVEIYVVIGDALYPYVQEIPASQKKLLTIYISKHMERS